MSRAGVKRGGKAGKGGWLRINRNAYIDRKPIAYLASGTIVWQKGGMNMKLAKFKKNTTQSPVPASRTRPAALQAMQRLQREIERLLENPIDSWLITRTVF